jgi:hypothetical protein
MFNVPDELFPFLFPFTVKLVDVIVYTSSVNSSDHTANSIKHEWHLQPLWINGWTQHGSDCQYFLG